MEYRENRDARRPFLSTPDSRVYFPAAAIEEARLSTARCLRRNEGVALVVGATGTGKTLLTRVLAAEFEAESLVAVVSPTRRVDAKSFWQQFLFGLRQTFCGCDETELRLMALDYLERSQRRRCVLLIDDAQNLPFRVFDELRSFVDQGAAASSQICVALFGTSSLEERLNLPPLYPFQQRIVSRSYLDAFENAEIADYIDCETRRVAGKFVFTSEAKRKVAELCKGAPRVANQLCDRALFLTAQERGKNAVFADKSDFNGNWEAPERIATESVEIQTVDATRVERAWSNLLNLPEETSRSTKTGDLSDVVEFGTLEDDEEENADFADFNGWKKRENSGNNAVADVEKESEVAEKGENNETRGFALEDAERVERNEKRNEEVETSDKEEALDAKEEEFSDELSDDENENDVDAALEARLLENLRKWEGAKEKRDEGDASGVNAVDRWERADALKERRETEGRKTSAKNAKNAEIAEIASVAEVEETAGDERTAESAGVAEVAEVAGIEEIAEVAKVAKVARIEEIAEIAKIEEDDAYLASNAFETIGEIGENKGNGEDCQAEKSEQKPEERVFEALKSEYFNEGFLFELGDDGGTNGGEGKKESRERGKKAKTRSKSTSKTRRPIVGADDGSRLWEEANGRSVDGGMLQEDDNRFFEAKMTSERVAKRSVSDQEAEAAAVDWEAEFVSLEDRAYEQIVEDCWETTGDFSASDEYLSELSLLEQEIEEEANLIRRIRNIHLKLRAVRAAGRKRRNDADAKEKNDSTPRNGEKKESETVNWEDEALNY